MTSTRAKRRSMRHPGVYLHQNASGGWVARWLDPLVSKMRQASLRKLGLTTEAARVRWAKAKSEQLLELKRRVSVGAVESRREGIDGSIDDYLNTFASKRTRTGKRRVLSTMGDFLRKCGCRDMADVQPRHVMRWRDSTLDPSSGRQTSTNNRWLATASAFLNWSEARGLLPMLGTDAIRKATKRVPEPKKEIVFLRPGEQRALLRIASEHEPAWAPVIMAYLLSGMRFEELQTLTWGAVDLEEGEIRLSHEVVKTNAARSIRLAETPSLLRLLQKLGAGKRPGDRVFEIGTNQALIHLAQRMERDHKAPRWTPHVLRRSCGTVLTNAPGIYGAASAWLSAKRLGHSVQQAEARYAGLLASLPREAETFEAAAGIEAECDAIVEMEGGLRAVV